ncbi:lantibiotic dehydratase, partial [Catellatospora sp. NPDC049609]|uniref:lantibiotic dehydratase n=1 Tax=Catellatospora sp. NPDC049609 TaxID=3155505 RepID=UPI00343DA3DF
MRATAHTGLELPAYPDVTDPAAADCATSWVGWLRAVWALPGVAETLRHASPVLARQIVVLISAGRPSVRDAYRAVLSVMRYLQRMTGRATPLGLAAGV